MSYMSHDEDKKKSKVQQRGREGAHMKHRP